MSQTRTRGTEAVREAIRRVVTWEVRPVSAAACVTILLTVTLLTMLLEEMSA